MIENYNSYYFINRELSWLEFNQRVLEEAKDKSNPLFERLRFLSIASSNLDEFFMVRVASLKDQVNADYDKPDPSGLTPKHQLRKISLRVRKMMYDQYNTYNRSLMPKLKKQGITIVKRTSLSIRERTFIQDYFTNIIYPALTPVTVDSSRQFPVILNKSLNIAMFVKDKSKVGKQIFIIVQVPSVLPRLVELIPDGQKREKRFILLEEVIMMFMKKIFQGHDIICASPFRITRNADLSIEAEEAEDLLIEIEKSLMRRTTGAVIRLEVDSKMSQELILILKDALEIHQGEIYHITGPIDLTFLEKFYSTGGYEHFKYSEHIPQMPKDFQSEEDIFEAISQKDIMLFHPYESFDPVIAFVKKAAQDPNVLAIKQTLYRVSGDSPIIEALSEAADRGKQVTVLIEVQARFDEENNIQWAKKLEQSGCHVIYGLVGLKTHCKITLVVRMEGNGTKRYVHLGTGNYNDITAKFYTDLGLFTCDEDIGSDASSLFNKLTGYFESPNLQKLYIAPFNLRSTIGNLIRRERENAERGKKARIIIKLNSLVDKEIIAELYKASSAGVKIELVIRGICCLRPGIPKISENITVMSIVGRFLEHTRLMYFYNDSQEEVYLSSADLMPRNLDRRVELMFSVEDETIRSRLIHILHITLKDTVKARLLKETGLYKRVDKRGKKSMDSQNFLCENIGFEQF